MKKDTMSAVHGVDSYAANTEIPKTLSLMAYRSPLPKTLIPMSSSSAMAATSAPLPQTKCASLKVLLLSLKSMT